MSRTAKRKIIKIMNEKQLKSKFEKYDESVNDLISNLNIDFSKMSKSDRKQYIKLKHVQLNVNKENFKYNSNNIK